MSARVVVATVLCGSCAGEHRREPAKLGSVEAWDSRLGTVEQWASGLVWRPYSRWMARAARRHLGYTPRDTAPLVALWVPGTPERLEAFCRHHGAGYLATDDVIAARGTVALNFTATG